MSLEQKINYQLNKIPGVKKVIKRVYQRTMYAISPKIKSEGNIVRVSPNDPSHCDQEKPSNGSKTCKESVVNRSWKLTSDAAAVVHFVIFTIKTEAILNVKL